MSSVNTLKANLEDSDSSGPEDRFPPPKKPKSTSSDVENMFKISKMRFVRVKEYCGRVLVDIREYYEKDGELRPGKKGMCLNVEQWQALKEHVNSIDAAIKKL